ncbi:MAG: pirin family protein [Flavobacteriales bacterium]|nr:pirin family protein [Flavobacteriales bacterium]
MKTTVHKSETRGHADHGWLKANHTFSFAGYYNPERIHFGVLRVLNDDWVAGGMGFSMHPHDNMEIITIPLSGAIKHKDNMGNTGVITAGEVQVMSAGTGVLHSEMNAHAQEPATLLQIWVMPDKKGVEPRYDQAAYDNTRKNEFVQVIAPMDTDEPGLNIHQRARFYLGKLDAGFEQEFPISDERNGLYIFVIDGEITVDAQTLSRRDGYGVWQTESVYIKAAADSYVLLMDVPMSL